jgi:hypothetical protein
MQPKKEKEAFHPLSGKRLIGKSTLYQDDKINAINTASSCCKQEAIALISRQDCATLWSTELNNTKPYLKL